MLANPILVQTRRDAWVENRHRGAIAVLDADGTVIASVGDIDRAVFPRSAIKSMQALAIFETGADGQFEMSEEELALACASHHGEDMHVTRVAAFLDRMGLSEKTLECGAHPPTNAMAREALRTKGAEPSALHNNCSGKHAGMLSTARAMGIDPTGYVGREHEVQKAVRKAIETVIGEKLDEARCGTDGCSIPTFAAPLRAFAHGFAKMATGKGLSDLHAKAAQRLFDAATKYPHLVSGTDHPDNRIMTAFAGRVMQKGGAEGVQCGAIRNKGWGYAMKCDDGNMAASHAMLAATLLKIADPDTAQRTVLESLASQTLRNVRKLEIGALEAVDPFPL